MFVRDLLLLRLAYKVLIWHQYSRATLLAESKTGLEELLHRVKEASRQHGLYLNLIKTKVMKTDGLKNFSLDGEPIEVVDRFVFLGAEIRDKGGCQWEGKPEEV